MSSLFGMMQLCRGEEAPGAARDDSASEKLGIKLSLQCWTFRQISFFSTVDTAKKYGIKYVEMYPGQAMKPDSKETVGREMSDAQCDEVLKKLADSDIKLIAYGVDAIPTDEAGRGRPSTGQRRWALRCW